MTDLTDILELAYKTGYDHGFTFHREHTSWFGRGPTDPPHDVMDANLTDRRLDEWKAQVYGNLDLSNIAYVQFKHAMPMSKDRTWSELKYVPHLDEKSEMEARAWLHEHLDLGSIAHGKTVHHVETDPAEYASRLREQLVELEEVNEALRATHPDGDIEDGEWELDATTAGNGKVAVPLNGDHVFDRAVIELDTDIHAAVGSAGELTATVDIESVKLVSSN